MYMNVDSLVTANNFTKKNVGSRSYSTKTITDIDLSDDLPLLKHTQVAYPGAVSKKHSYERNISS